MNAEEEVMVLVAAYIVAKNKKEAQRTRRLEPNCTLKDDDIDSSTSSAYSNQSKASKRRKVEEPIGGDDISNLLGEYLKELKEKAQTPTRSIFSLWSDLLGKLPRDVATATEMEMTNLLYAKVQKHCKP